MLGGARVVRTEGTVLDGPVVGKYLSREKFQRAIPLGPAVSDMVFAFDIAGTPQLWWWADWRADCLGDIHQRPELDTLVKFFSSQRRHTSWNCDWSSDVCSSDLPAGVV